MRQRFHGIALLPASPVTMWLLVRHTAPTLLCFLY